MGKPETAADRIEKAVQGACILEVMAHKPGNVTPSQPFSDTVAEDYLLSAVSIGPVFRAANSYKVGELVFTAVRETRNSVQVNTNLGIILLFAPLVKAALASWDRSKEVPHFGGPEELRSQLSLLLSSLDRRDAEMVYRAIRIADAGGINSVEEGDIQYTPDFSLFHAMDLAKDRDSIAREYVTDFDITFELAYPTLKNLYDERKDLSNTVVQTFITILKNVPDTLIARKAGMDKAKEVSEWAGTALDAGGVYTSTGRRRIEELDKTLRQGKNKLNPGTSADLTAAALLLLLLYDVRL